MRARELGIELDGKCGKNNAITDVPGVEVGFATIIKGEPSPDNTYDSDFARTGVTCILPRGRRRSAVFAGRAVLNGNGEMTGSHWVDDSGFVHGPIMLTNTNSVGIVRDSTSKWLVKNNLFPLSYKDGHTVPGLGFFYPVVGETFDGALNNINGFKVTEEDVFAAIDSASDGPVQEGNVGGGTGMRCHGFKGGTGTSSRIVKSEVGEFTLGVLVQANHGAREELKINGVPVGKQIEGYEQELPCLGPKEGDGSIIVIIATDAPFLPWQLSKIARRASMGLARLGGGNQNGSGDIFLAFSTANDGAFCYTSTEVTLMSDEQIDPFFTATAEATEEAILNALFSAETMCGRNMNTVYAIPHDQVKTIMSQTR